MLDDETSTEMQRAAARAVLDREERRGERKRERNRKKNKGKKMRAERNAGDGRSASARGADMPRGAGHAEPKAGVTAGQARAGQARYPEKRIVCQCGLL